MDVLSEIFSSIRIDGSALAEMRCGGVWGCDMGSGEGVAFHYLIEGQCWLLGGPAPTMLSAGDLVVAMHWPHHALVSTPDAPLMTAEELVASNKSLFWTSGTLARPNILYAGDGTHNVTILSGLFSVQGRGVAMLIDQLPSLMHLGVQDENLAPQLKMALNFIHYESKATRPGYAAVATRLMDLLFIQILRSAISQRSVPIGLLAGLADPNISMALGAIHASPSTNWSVSSLAREACLSRTIFAERFKKVVGITPIQYVSRWRMTIAEDLLAKSNLNVDVIRSQLGYGSSFVFARAFRAHSGFSPREYRRSMRERQTEDDAA